MATLRVIADEVLADEPNEVGRYTLELTRQLVVTAPSDCNVEAVVSSHTPAEEQRLRERIPGLARVQGLKLGHRELAIAWQAGARVRLDGMVHAPSLLAPLRKHERRDESNQVSITIQDLAAWTSPDSLPATEVLWQKAMVKRARKFADAVVVPTHAVATQLNEIAGFGQRIRVIGAAPSSSLQLPINDEERAIALGLPDEYVATIGTLDPRRGLRALIEAMALPGAHDVPLVIVGPDEYGDQRVSEIAMAAGLPEGRVRPIGVLSQSDLAVVLDRATAFVYPSLSAGFGLPIVEAFRFGTPVIHSDHPALLETAGDSGLAVERTDASGYPARLADAIDAVLTDDDLAERLSVEGQDRSRAFSWRDSAERLWQLHADL
jgi:glycosyltransferase involved in cell wall biosynthesis